MLAFRFSRRMWVLRYSLAALAGFFVEASSWTAAAQNVAISFSGILNESYDACGYFGPPAGNLQGDAFTATISYNSSDFTYYSQSNLWGANTGAAMTTSLSINGITRTIVTGSTPLAIGQTDIVPNTNYLQFGNYADSVNPRDDNPSIDFAYATNGTLTNLAEPPSASPGGSFYSAVDLVNANGVECAEAVFGVTGGLSVISPFLLGKSGKGLGDLNLNTILPTLQTPDSATALAADGTSAAIVLLQVSSMNPVTFTTNNGTTLLKWDKNFLKKAPSQGQTTLDGVVPVQIGSLLYAEALLQAPPAGAIPAFSTPITITAQQQGGQLQQAYLPLAPPPIVLVHGIWGNNKSLANVKSYLTSTPPWQSQPGLVASIQYTNDIAFDNSEPSEALGAEIHNILRAAIAQGIVVGRIDLIAHSMGGLVALHYSTLTDYKAIYDRTEGRFHTIITLDTPESGSLLAAYLFTHAGDWYGLNGSDDLTENAKPPSHTWPWIVWNAACGDVLHSTTVEVCFAGKKMNSPLAPAGQPLTSGAVYSLIPGGKSLSNLPPANIPNALWLAVSALRPASDGYSGESALQFELESLIAATYKNQETAPTISSILVDQGQDDVIVPLTSQLAGALPAQFATVDDLAHSPPADPPWLIKYGLGLSLANVENSSPVNALVACWLETEGASACIAQNARESATGSNRATSPSRNPTEIVPVNRLSLVVPPDLRLAEPFELGIRMSPPQLTHLSVTQVDRFGHVDESKVKIIRIKNGIAYAEVTPVLFGPVTFTVDARLMDDGYSSKAFRATVGLPTARLVAFHADFNNWRTFYLSLAEGGDVGELHPEAIFASAPDRKISLDGWVKFAVTPADDRSIIQLNENGTFKALREGAATVEARFGGAITQVKVVVEDTLPR